VRWSTDVGKTHGDAFYEGGRALSGEKRERISHVESTSGEGHRPVADQRARVLAEPVVAIDDLGGRVNLVGLCQGGWVSAMLAARFPDKVPSLVLAGAPIHTDAGDGPITRMVHESPISFYEELVALGGGLMKSKFLLQGGKNIRP
jgi:pimeloyl-ACP methyl ester carboxylesterase